MIGKHQKWCFFIAWKRGVKMPKTAELNKMQIGNTTFYVTSVFAGSVQLQQLIKRLIRKEIEQKGSTY